MSTIRAFDNIENRYSLYRGEYCMKKFCTSLREHVTSMIKFEKTKILPLTKKSQNYNKMQQHVTFVEKKFQKKFAKDNIYGKVRGNCHFTGNYEVQHIVYVI